MENHTDFYVGELRPVIGGKIIGTIQTPVNKRTQPNDMFFGLKIEMPNGTIYHLWFLQDDEGNGSGSLDLVNITAEIKRTENMELS